MRIELDRLPLKRPAYLNIGSTNLYYQYLLNARSYPTEGWQTFEDVQMMREPDQKALHDLRWDPKFIDYLINSVRNGSNLLGVWAASRLADEMADVPGWLEVVPTEGKVFNQNLREEYAEQFCGPVDASTPKLGMGLRRGTIVYRGNVGEVTDLRGGTLLIDGDVNRIAGLVSGNVFVRGRINEIRDIKDAVIRAW